MADPRTSSDEVTGSADAAAALAAEWIARAEPPANAVDPALAYALADGLLRPGNDVVVAAGLAAGLRGTVPNAARSRLLRTTRRLGVVAGPLLPLPFVPAARRTARRLGADFVVDSRPNRVGPVLDALRAEGVTVAVRPEGAVVTGPAGERRRLAELTSFATRDGIGHLVIDLAAIAAWRDPWDFDRSVDQLFAGLRPVLAAAEPGRLAVDLEVDRHGDVDLGIGLLIRALDDPDLAGLDIGLGLPAAAPDAPAAIRELAAWSAARIVRGAPPVRVRVNDRAGVEGARIDAALDGRPPAESGVGDEAFSALLLAADGALRAEVASTDPRRLARAHTEAQEDGRSLVLQLPYRPGDRLPAAIVASGGVVRVVVSVADRAGRDAAILATTRRAVAASTVPGADSVDPVEPDTTPPIVRPPAADAGLTQAVLGIARGAAPDTADGAVVQFAGQHFVETAVYSDRESPDLRGSVPGFRHVEPADPSRADARARGRDLVAAIEDDARSGSRAGDEPPPLSEPEAAALVERAAASAWRARPAADRSETLVRAAAAVAGVRDELVRALAVQTGVWWDAADRQVDAAIDAVRHAAHAARELDRTPGAVFVPARVTLVRPGAARPLAAAAQDAADALGAGSAVLLVAGPDAPRALALLVAAFRGSGVPADALVAVDPAAATTLATHPAVTRELAPIAAGRIATIVAPSADIDLAAADLIRTAVIAASEGGSALAILVGSVGRSRRFAHQLADAAHALRLDGSAGRGGVLPAPLQGARLDAATGLDDGEAWLVEPVRHEADGAFADRRWDLGVRVGVQSGSRLLQLDGPVPVLAVLHAGTFEEAVAVQRRFGTGLDAGLHTRDLRDLERWLDADVASSLWVNRAVGPAAVQRHPRAAGVRAALPARGGAHRLLGLGRWRASDAAPSPTLHLRGLDSRIAGVIEAAQPSLDYRSFEWLRRAALADAVAWDREFGRVRDVAQRDVERNLVRYRPADVAIRAVEGAAWRAVLRLAIAAVRTGSPTTVSVAEPMPAGIRRALGDLEVPVHVESDERWLQRLAVATPHRVRLTGPEAATAAAAAALAAALPETAAYADEVTTAGRIELLPFLVEQSITIAAHRAGLPDPWSLEVL